jgi:hypothetical protein
MQIIVFRIRPPYKSFLQTAMYDDAACRDRMTRHIGFEPSAAAQQQSVPLLLAEMDQAGVGIGVVVGRKSGTLGNVDNADIKELCDAYPGRFVGAVAVNPVPHRPVRQEVDAHRPGIQGEARLRKRKESSEARAEGYVVMPTMVLWGKSPGIPRVSEF